MRMQVQYLALLSGSGIWVAMSCGVGCKRLRSDIAVAVVQASSYSSDSTPSLGNSIYHGCSLKKTKKKKKNVLFLVVYGMSSHLLELGQDVHRVWERIKQNRNQICIYTVSQLR